MLAALNQGLALLTDTMVWIILIAGVAEAMLFVHVRRLSHQQMLRVRDTLVNLSKGLADRPDLNSQQSIEDQCRALTAPILRALGRGGAALEAVQHGLVRQAEKNSLQSTFALESRTNLASAMVQVFPLLGILGTILALNQAAFAGGAQALEASAVTRAFVVAIDTTILGLLMAVVFMVWEAAIQARVGRVLEATQSCQALLDHASADVLDHPAPPPPRPALAAPSA